MPFLNSTFNKIHCVLGGILSRLIIFKGLSIWLKLKASFIIFILLTLMRLLSLFLNHLLLTQLFLLWRTSKLVESWIENDWSSMDSWMWRINFLIYSHLLISNLLDILNCHVFIIVCFLFQNLIFLIKLLSRFIEPLSSQLFEIIDFFLFTHSVGLIKFLHCWEESFSVNSMFSVKSVSSIFDFFLQSHFRQYFLSIEEKVS